MMETENVIEVKKEPIDSDEGETDPISYQDEDDQMSTENIAKQPKQSKGVSPARPSTPPYYTQNHNVGGKWKVAKEKKQYNCKTCKFKFTSKTWLSKHERMHEDMENKAKLYKCEICRKEFTQKIIYHDHMAAHEGRRPYVCDRCGMDFTWYRAFYRHQQSHKTGGQEFSCHLCHRRFNSNWNLARHLKEIHLSQQTFQCYICEELFEKKNLYQIHMKAHDRDERDSKKKNGIVSERVKQKHLKVSKLVCAMVQSQSRNKNKDVNIQESDMSSDDEITASELIGNFTEDSEMKDINSSYGDCNDAEFFQKVSNSQETDDNCLDNTSEAIIEEIESQEINSALAKTIKTVTKSSLVSSQKQKPQPICDICGKSVYNLDAHLRIHSGDKPFRCCLCDKDFAQREALKIHYRSHTGEKPFLCSTCGKGFATRGLQQDHARAHKGDKPYQCDVCDARFSWRCALSRHKQLHSTGPKPHSCSVCTFECWRKHDLVKHEKTHLYDNHYQCDFENCTAIFTNKKHFVKHKNEHKGPENSVSKVSPRSGRIIRIQRAKKDDNTDQTESNVNHPTDFHEVEIKQEPVDEFVDDEHHILDKKTSDTPTMYITSNEGQMPTVITNTTGEEETDPDSGKLRYVKGKRLHLNQDLQRLLSKKLNERKMAKPCISGVGSSSVCLASKIEERTHGLGRQASCDSEVEALKHRKNQVTISMDDVIEKDCQSTKTCDKSKSNSNQVCCEVCGKTLNISYYHIHVRKHMEEMAHTCEICNKSFSRKPDLIVHSRVHTNIRPFQCRTCPKAFKVKSLLEDHVRSHDGIKPYVCSLCDASFAWRCAFHRHVKTHSIKKPFQCDVCGKDFRRRRDWTFHIERKTCKFAKTIIYKCNDCQAVFANLETLVYHNEKHHKETPSLNVLDIQTKSPPFFDTSSDASEALPPDSMLSPSNEMTGNPDVFDEESLPESDVVDEQNKAYQTCPDESIDSDTDKRKPVIPYHPFVALNNCIVREGDDSERATEVNDEDKTDISLAKSLLGKIKKECVDSDSIFISNVAHTCEICNKSFSRKTDFIIHSRVHTNIRPFQCRTCPKAFKVKSLLEDHVRSHDGIKPYVCSLCDASFAWRCAFHRHVKTHSIKKPFQCDVCGKDFRRRRDWTFHIERKTCKFAKTIIYKCNDCQAVFANLETLVYHNEKHHKETPSLNVLDIQTKSPPFFDTSSDASEALPPDSMLSPSNEMTGNPDVFDEESLPESDVVDEQNKSYQKCPDESIDSDTDSRKPVIPCDPFLTEVDDEDKTDIPLAESLLCNIKKECVDSDSILITNINSTESMKDSSTFSNTDLNNQSNSKQDPDHIGNNMLPLNTNAYAFINWTGGNLQIEPSSVNESSLLSGVTEDRLKCKICGRCFVSSLGLKVHLRIHSKDAMDIYALHFRPDELMTKSKKEKEARNLKYKCELCDKTFPFASGLRIHMMAHSGKLPYSCKTCGKRFPYLESLKSHMRVHTGERPFTCTVCGKSFAYRHNHDDHYRTHTGDKPYKCDRCDSAFTWKSALHRHHKTHNLETLEVCSICKAKFKNGGQLVRHMNRFHSSLI
ncbi:zinc finger protein Xfin-like [Mizuhopecten yessoensis]|uniref:zinc finger protein Xfin-like n=1 Tax=Mizuhopecten yessoensis TaxID=6573 RepID=UPI000B45A990|nr:zinc finger protein Xfin-like [Mizuhopecten yessoensis]